MTFWAGLAVAVVAVSVGGGVEEPLPLSGDPLRTTNGLRLLVADEPPFVLDVDSGSIVRVRGVAGPAAVVALGGRYGIVLANDVAFAVSRSGRVARLGPALAAVAAADGRSVWLKARTGGRCVLRRLRVDAAVVGASRPFPCGWTIQSGGTLGIVARRTQVLDPATGRTVLRARWGILAAAGDKLVLALPGRRLKLAFTSGGDLELRWPSPLRHLDAPAVDPTGRYVALGFADPAWVDQRDSTVSQIIDVWILDTRSGELTHLPGLPAFAGLKVTSMQWANDRRLVLLGQDDRRPFVAVWRPGDAALAIKTIRLPRRSGYSDASAPLP